MEYTCSTFCVEQIKKCKAKDAFESYEGVSAQVHTYENISTGLLVSSLTRFLHRKMLITDSKEANIQVVAMKIGLKK